jgi:hypothetical protein
MLRWICTALAVVAALTWATLAQPPGGAAPRPHDEAHHGKLSPVQEKCAKACVECARECEACFDHCATLTSEGKKEHLRSLKSTADCGDICLLAAKVIARNGALQAEVCEGCARACDSCGKECEKFPHDPMMKKTADACKACAQACREMTQHAGHHDHEKK